MKFRDVKLFMATLVKHLKWSLPVVCLQAFMLQRTIVKKSSWAGRKDDEAAMVKRISIIPAFYQVFEKKFGSEKAKDILKEAVVPGSVMEQWDLLNQIPKDEGDSLDRLKRYWTEMNKRGVGRFNESKTVRSDDQVFQEQTTKCMYYNFMQEAGTPELTQIFCDSDSVFFPEAFPNLKFHRGDSPQNTLAYGRDHCDYIFEKKIENQ